jgi:hypothetical protein
MADPAHDAAAQSSSGHPPSSSDSSIWASGSALLSQLSESEQVDRIRSEADRLMAAARQSADTNEGKRLQAEGEKLKSMLEVCEQCEHAGRLETLPLEPPEIHCTVSFFLSQMPILKLTLSISLLLSQMPIRRAADARRTTPSQTRAAR